LNCKAVRGLVTGFIDRQLEPEATAAVEDHLSHCPACAKAATQERRLKQAVSGMEREKPPAELSRRIKDSLAKAKRAAEAKNRRRATGV
jgi:anti-sigma factor RsiW